MTVISKPSSVQTAITYRCNLKCLHCDIWKSPATEELNLTQWLKILKKMRDWLGPFWFNISGGEPFLRKDLLDIITYCNINNIRVVVTTNGTLLNPESIKILSSMKNLTVNVSVDGVNADTHDYLRNKKGVYDKAMNTLLEFRKKNRSCYITMSTILMGYNTEEVIPLIKKAIVDKLADDITFQALDYNFHAAYNDRWFEKNRFWVSEEKRKVFNDTIDSILRIKEAGAPVCNTKEQLLLIKRYFNDPDKSIDLECNTGNSNFIINPNGDVLLCWNMKPIGNILKDNPADIWSSSAADGRRVQISKCKRTCRILNCNFSEVSAI